jgi:predicted membrane GTPase involved in stress response
VLIETMRREGFELSVSRPRVLFAPRTRRQRTEPIEKSSSTSTTNIPASSSRRWRCARPR